MRFICNLIVLTLCFVIWYQVEAKAEETNTLVALRDASNNYLNKFVEYKERKKLVKDIQESIEEKIRSNSALNDNTALNEIVLSFASSSKEDIKNRDQKKIIKACLFFCYYVDNNMILPKQVRDGMKPEDTQKLIDWLNKQVSEVPINDSKAGEQLKDGPEDKRASN